MNYVQDEIEHLNYVYLLTISLTLCILTSLFLNGLQLYYFSVIKKKITVDYIKAQIFVVNIVFTVIAMPYYILKENQFLNLNSCKILYFLSDFIMFVYNNLLILMAIDRFLFICTRYRYNMKRWFITFYTVTIQIALISVTRLYTNDCRISFVSLRNILSLFPINYSLDIYIKTNYMTIYNIVILMVMAFNWFLSICLYTYIVVYVYKKSISSSKFLKVKFQKCSQSNWTVGVNSSYELNNAKIETSKYRLSYEIYYNLIKSKHWKITKTLIKV
jgi:hypothetical protein